MVLHRAEDAELGSSVNGQIPRLTPICLPRYTDWILAAISGSYWGFPATGNLGITIVYVVFYFVVRLMPVLSA